MYAESLMKVTDNESKMVTSFFQCGPLWEHPSLNTVLKLEPVTLVVATPVFIAAIKSTKVKLHGNNVCDIIIAYVISADTQTNRRRKCKHYM